jgi:uncharacterized protein YkwD
MMLLGLAACAEGPGYRQSGERPRPVEFSATDARDWLTNYRQGRGLTPVQLDSSLTAMAQRQANVMAEQDVLSHSVDASFASRVRAAGVGARTAENVLYGAYTTGGAMAQWQRSPPHEANMRLENASRFGIAWAQSSGPKHRVYWAMDIAAAAPPPPQEMASTFLMEPVRRRVIMRRVRELSGPGVLSPLTSPITRLFGY